MHRLAIYPGTFDPPTLGHLDVIERASKLFERVIVGVGVNLAKEPLLSTQMRIQALSDCTKHLPGVSVDSFSGLLVDFAERVGAKAIVRGLRATSDFDYEFQMAMVNRRLNFEIESVFLMTKWEHSYLSSSVVREVALLGGNYRELVPPEVAKIMEEALKARQ